MRRAGSGLWQCKRCLVFSSAAIGGAASASVSGRGSVFPANGRALRTTPRLLAPHDGHIAASPPPAWGSGTAPVWEKDLTGTAFFHAYMKDLDVDGLRKAIKAELGTDFTGCASAIKIYDHQGQAMEHPGQAVSPNTSETPYLYQLPIVWVRDRSDASPYPLILPVLNVAHMRQAVKARLQGEQASVKESAIEIYDHQEQAMAAEQPVDDAAALRPNSRTKPYIFVLPKKLEPTLEDLILRMNAVGTTPSSRIASGKLKGLITGAANSVLRGVPYVKSETARQIFDT